MIDAYFPVYRVALPTLAGASRARPPGGRWASIEEAGCRALMPLKMGLKMRSRLG